MKNLYIRYEGAAVGQRLTVEDDVAAELERQTLEGYEVPFRVIDHGGSGETPPGSVVLIRPSSIASMRISETPSEMQELPPIDVQAVADRMRELGVEFAYQLSELVPPEMGALRREDAYHVFHGRSEASESARRKVAAALGMDEDWLL